MIEGSDNYPDTGGRNKVLPLIRRDTVKAYTYVTPAFSRMVSLCPLLNRKNAWVGAANSLCGTIKISKGKHIRDDRVLARDFNVAILVREHAWVWLFE
jgi:hypothetical protein